MNDRIVDIYHYDDFDEVSDLKEFGVNEDEQNLNYREELFD